MQLALFALLPLLASLSQAIPVPRHLHSRDLTVPQPEQPETPESHAVISDYSPLNVTLDGRGMPSIPKVPVVELSKGTLPMGVPADKMTNAQRLANGMGPLPPTRRSTFAPRAGPSQVSMQPNDRTATLRVVLAANNEDLGMVSQSGGGGSNGGDGLLTFSATGTPIRFSLPSNGDRPFELAPADAGDDLFGRPRRLLGAMPHRPDGGNMGPGSPNFANIGQGDCDPSSGLLGLNLPPLPLSDTAGNVLSGLPAVLAGLPETLGSVTSLLNLDLSGGGEEDGSGGLGLLKVAGPLGLLGDKNGKGGLPIVGDLGLPIVGDKEDGGDLGLLDVAASLGLFESGVDEASEKGPGGLPLVKDLPVGGKDKGGDGLGLLNVAGPLGLFGDGGGQSSAAPAGLPMVGDLPLGGGKSKGGDGLGLLNVAGPLGVLGGGGGEQKTAGPASSPPKSGSPLGLLGVQLPHILGSGSDSGSGSPLARGLGLVNKLASIPTSHAEPAGPGAGHFPLDTQRLTTASAPIPMPMPQPIMQTAQSAIWKCDAVGQMSAVWQNPGGDRVPTRFFTGGPCAHTVCLAVDIQALQAIHGAEVIEVKLVAGLL